MKQYDSYLIYGCHFPKTVVDIITVNSSLKYFNTKIHSTYGCEIIEVDVPVNDKIILKQYLLKIIFEQSEQSILKIEDIKNVDLNKYREILELFEIGYIDPYFISIPIVRELPSYQ